MSDLRIGTGFVAHYEGKGGGVGNGMGGGVVCEFRHGKEFGPFRRLISGEDPKISFQFLVDPFGFAVGLRVIGGGKGDIIVKKAGEFSCEGGGKLGAPIGDYSFVEAEAREDVLEKDLGDVRRGGGFVARAENYPLRKTVVYHDQNRIVAVGEGEICDKIHGDLLEGTSAL